VYKPFVKFKRNLNACLSLKSRPQLVPVAAVPMRSSRDDRIWLSLRAQIQLEILCTILRHTLLLLAVWCSTRWLEITTDPQIQISRAYDSKCKLLLQCTKLSCSRNSSCTCLDSGFCVRLNADIVNCRMQVAGGVTSMPHLVSRICSSIAPASEDERKSRWSWKVFSWREDRQSDYKHLFNEAYPTGGVARHA
jgi:hypothetical protein